MWQQKKKKSGFLLLKWKRVVCLVKKHSPIGVIDKAHIESVSTDELGMLSVRGRITEKHVECYRCKKRLPDANNRRR